MAGGECVNKAHPWGSPSDKTGRTATVKGGVLQRAQSSFLIVGLLSSTNI